jgi:hypothetical protein
MRLGPVLAALLLLASAGACSLAVDATDIDEGCRVDEKDCSGKCVLISNPAYGCDPVDCTLSCAYAHAIPKCDENFQCAIDTCLEGYCGDDCETNKLVDDNNCGTCGFACQGTETCRNGECVPK